MCKSCFATLLVTACLLVNPGAAISSSYSIADIGALPAAIDSQPRAINDLGQIVGGSGDRAFQYTAGVMTDLGTLGGSFSFAEDINNSGHSVGVSFNAGNVNRRAFLHAGGTMTDLGTVGGHTESVAAGINDLGQVVGYSYTSFAGQHRAFLYSGGVMTDLYDDFNTGFNLPADINNAGQIVGIDGLNAVLYDSGVVTNLGDFGGFTSYATAINESGQVVGAARTANNDDHAFLYSGGVLTDLGTLGGVLSVANDINDAGEIVGGSLLANNVNFRAYLYKDGTMTDLNSLLAPGSGWILEEAMAINALGQITGTGTYLGQSRAFLLTPDSLSPVPEPASLTLLAMGAAMATLALRRRRTRVPKAE